MIRLCKQNVIQVISKNPATTKVSIKTHLDKTNSQTKQECYKGFQKCQHKGQADDLKWEHSTMPWPRGCKDKLLIIACQKYVKQVVNLGHKVSACSSTKQAAHIGTPTGVTSSRLSRNRRKSQILGILGRLGAHCSHLSLILRKLLPLSSGP